ncbi:penicillin-binding protein 1C [Bartonella sp. HY406]|uniref:penicillin-binding protein 1C n=1 Tax=Bartonella sp. HY406 TaxID=2979331 RepID=UPI0021C6936E|nr:penicillin-binding protein 1C [Bartonella sp. HY406]UXN04869.1 penicillin-binding protein 1C [Bartonella sp. HY406]
MRRRFFTKSRLRRYLRIFLYSFAFLSLVLIALRLWPHTPLKEQFSYSKLVSDQNGQILRLTLSKDDHYRLFVPLEDMSPVMVEAIMLKEDRYFYSHFGVNPFALFRASLATYIGGNRQGASTLTMQLARKIYNINSRSISGKTQQILAALWLEARYSKAEILEAYLNLAPMGGNIEGVEAASQIYFHKSAQKLSLNEALALAVIPQSPTKRASFGLETQKARLLLLNDWRDANKNDPRSAALNDLPITAYTRRDLPFLAPHYSDYLLANYPEDQLQGTLDLKLQKAIEAINNGYIKDRSRVGIRNSAILIIDSRDMGIKTMIGSADFFNEKIHGQVNGTIAARSPGSTVKPFLYALAIDQGIIHPMTMLKDAPTMFGSFQPENFDGRFVGPLSAQEALIRSRNVPAVWLASKTRKPSLYQFLKNAGITGLRPEESYGLSIALGGGEMKMLELASLYASLAKDGKRQFPRFLKTELYHEGEALISPEASFITRQMLYQNPRPDGLPKDRRGKDWPVAWKTGTSWSYHDAWTSGMIGPYIVVVWIGNFDNSGPTAFIGVRSAAPLFFKIADALPILKPNEKQLVQLSPKNVVRVDVCAASGDLPNEYCPKRKQTWFIAGVSPIKISNLHRPLMIDTRSGEIACPPYDKPYIKQQIFEFWPSDLNALFDTAGLPRRKPPTQKTCGITVKSDNISPPQIRYPLVNVTYVLKRDDENDHIRLEADAPAGVKRLYWFEKDRFLGVVTPGTSLDWRPKQAGRMQLRVSDENGNTTLRTINVNFN